MVSDAASSYICGFSVHTGKSADDLLQGQR